VDNSRGDQQEIKVTISDKTKAGGLISLSISKMISPDSDAISCIERLTDEVQGLLQKKLADFAPKEVQNVQQQFNVPQQNVVNQSIIPNCPVCGKQMKMNKAGTYLNCIMAKMVQDPQTQKWTNMGCNGKIKL